MLVLSRKVGESIMIQDDIEVTILEVNADTVKIGISAPKTIEILRKEIYAQIKQTNRESAASAISMQDLRNQLVKMKKNNEPL